MHEKVRGIKFPVRAQLQSKGSSQKIYEPINKQPKFSRQKTSITILKNLLKKFII